jgi:hypothetical protein
LLVLQGLRATELKVAVCQGKVDLRAQKEGAESHAVDSAGYGQDRFGPLQFRKMLLDMSLKNGLKIPHDHSLKGQSYGICSGMKKPPENMLVRGG